MTVRKHFKQLVRERMIKTGESYSSARRQLLRLDDSLKRDPAARWHFPGSVAASTALRTLLASAGLVAPHTGQPLSEAMAFGIAGGVGVGVAAFRYEKEDCSTIFVAGRHLWFDDQAYLETALGRLGLKPVVKECAGAKPGEKNLRDLLRTGPCVAWVDMTHLPHRALPLKNSGGGYHVITVYRIDDEAGVALIGDMTDTPIAIPLADLATARARIKKQAFRVMGVAPAKPHAVDLRPLVLSGLKASHSALTAKPGKGALAWSTLESLRRWETRLAGSTEKDRWEKMFPRGHNLWGALTSLYLWIELYGTGGGLCRPLMADFLAEAWDAIGKKALSDLARDYEKIGQAWSRFADAALPDQVPMFRQAKDLYLRYSELFSTNGSVEEKHNVWSALDELAAQAKKEFPLSDAECADLRSELQGQLHAITQAEAQALVAMNEIVSSAHK